MSIAARIRALIQRSQTGDTAISWPAMRLLGILSERLFDQAVAALEDAGHDGGCETDCEACEVLADVEETLKRINSEESPL